MKKKKKKIFKGKKNAKKNENNMKWGEQKPRN